MIYLDHAATSWPKPPEVAQATAQAGAQDKPVDMKKLLAEIVGDYEFSIQGQSMLVQFTEVEGKLFGAPPGETPEQIMPVEGKALCFDVTLAQSGAYYQLQFVRNDKGVIDKSMEGQMYDTFLASAFRSIRFGVTEAHGKGIALQLNYLTDNGAFAVQKDGTFAVDQAKIRRGVDTLTRDLLTLEAQGDYAKAKDMLSRLAVVRPDVQKLLDRLGSVPVDIEPRFPTASLVPTTSARRITSSGT